MFYTFPWLIMEHFLMCMCSESRYSWDLTKIIYFSFSVTLQPRRVQVLRWFPECTRSKKFDYKYSSQSRSSFRGKPIKCKKKDVEKGSVTICSASWDEKNLAIPMNMKVSPFPHGISILSSFVYNFSRSIQGRAPLRSSKAVQKELWEEQQQACGSWNLFEAACRSTEVQVIGIKLTDGHQMQYNGT